MKKSILTIWGAAGVISLLAGCATTPIALAPVGPNPIEIQAAIGSGQLEVFSALSARSEGNNPTWYQHSSYYICDEAGKRLEHVNNAAGHYAEAPRTVRLPAGEYIIKARAKGALWAEIPVVIRPGELTKIHLDGQWAPSASSTELVSAPAGYPVGWRAGVTQ